LTPLGGDEIRCAADQHGIVQHQQLRVEDGGEVRPFQLGDAAPNLLQLFVRTRRARSSADSSRATRSGAIGKRMTCVR
jgi:hypothetical protein